MAATGSGFVAAGDDHLVGNWDAAVWFSPDGVTWLRVPHVGPVFGGAGNQSMWDVTTVGTDLVAVGESGGGEDWDAAAWVRRPSG